MTDADIFEIIRKALSSTREVTADDSVDTLPQWDSLGQLAILVALDKKLNGKAAGIKKLASCQSIRALIHTLRENNLLK